MNTNLLHALYRNRDCFRSLCCVTLPEQHQVYRDKYSLLFPGTKVNGKRVILRIFTDTESPSAQEILISAQRITEDPRPLFPPLTYLPKEIRCGGEEAYDAVMIEWDSDHAENLYDHLVTHSGAETLVSMLSGICRLTERGALIDRFSLCDCWFNESGNFFFLPSGNLLYRTEAFTTGPMQCAFRNFLLMKVIEIIDLSSRFDSTLEDRTPFDTRNLDYYLNDRMVETICENAGVFIADDHLRELIRKMVRDTEIDKECIAADWKRIRQLIQIGESRKEKQEPLFDPAYKRYKADEQMVTLENREDGLFALATKAGHFKSDFIFEYIGSFEEGIAIVQRSGLYGAINREAEYVVPPVYEILEWESRTNRFLFKQGGR